MFQIEKMPGEQPMRCFETGKAYPAHERGRHSLVRETNTSLFLLYFRPLNCIPSFNKHRLPTYEMRLDRSLVCLVRFQLEAFPSEGCARMFPQYPSLEPKRSGTVSGLSFLSLFSHSSSNFTWRSFLFLKSLHFALVRPPVTLPGRAIAWYENSCSTPSLGATAITTRRRP
jgi:hypothetical protein